MWVGNKKKKKKKGCSSGTVRLCLHFLALLGWVSCNGEVAIASAHYNLIQKKPNQQHHFTITWLPFAELVLICIVYPLTSNPVNPRIGATLIHCKYRKSIQLKKEWHEREISQWSAISGNSRTALIEHYQCPLLHYAWNSTHCVGEVCNDRVPEVPPCCGTPQSSMGVPWKQFTIVNMETDTTI